MTQQVVSANRLADGRVVYLAAEGGWTRELAAARRADGKEAGAALLAEAEAGVRRCEVVAPTLVELQEEAAETPGELPGLRRLRERIRDRGPTRETGRLLTEKPAATAAAGGL